MNVSFVFFSRLASLIYLMGFIGLHAAILQPDSYSLFSYFKTDNPSYQTINDEIDRLISTIKAHDGLIPLLQPEQALTQEEELTYQQAQNCAPYLYTYLHTWLDLLTEHAGIQKPELYLFVTPNNRTYLFNKYNKTTTIRKPYRYTNSLSEKAHIAREDSIKLHKNMIVIGVEALKLLAFKVDHMNFIPALMAHEIGHILHNNEGHSIESELLADEAAATLLKKLHEKDHLINPNQLISAFMLTLLGETLYSKAHNYTTLEHKQLSELVRLTTSNLLEINKNLGNLSWLETTSDFFKIIDDLTYKTINGLTSEIYEIEKYERAWTLRRKINKVCSQDISATISCFNLKKRLWRWRARQATHPGPSERIENILAAINSIY